MINWGHWHNEPHLVGGLVLIGWLYALLTGPLRERLAGAGTPFPRAEAWKFYLSLVIFYFAVGSPLDQIGERFLLTAHMVQHQLIIYPAAALFLLGLPAWLVRPVTGRFAIRQLLRFAAHPTVCALIYVLTLSVWHHPGLYDWALQDRPVHIAEHVMFFGAALFYWWPVLSPSTELPPLRPGPQMLYQIAVVIAMTPLFVYLAFSSDYPLYPTYEYAPRLIAMVSPIDDQLFAAAIMKVGGMFVAFVVFAVAFARWQRLAKDTLATKA
jgi:putative membrane protein